MTREEWIERYRRAWETADADEIVDLFTPDVSYRSRPVPSLADLAGAAHWSLCPMVILGSPPIPL